MELILVDIRKPESINFILGQSHFIKTVEDIHEALVSAVPGIGTDTQMIALAQENAMRIGAGHSFILFLDEGFYPINVLKQIQNVGEVTGIYCATANPARVIMDGEKPRGIEEEAGISWRTGFLRKIGYKLG